MNGFKCLRFCLLNFGVFSQILYHDSMAKSFVKRLETEYLSAKIVLSTDELNERRGRQLAL